MTVTTADEVYEQIVKQLSPSERIRLVEKIAHELSALSVEATGEVDSSPQKRNGKEALQRMVEVSEEMGLYDE